MTDKTPSNSRRTFLSASAALPALGMGLAATGALAKDKEVCPPVKTEPPQVYGSKNFFLKQVSGGQPVKLYMWRKQIRDRTLARRKGVIVFVHGSSMSGTPVFDLRVPGKPDYSVMDHFARLGYDTWCPDMEGYGLSDKSRDINFDVANGADDLLTISNYIAQATGQKKVMYYGLSSGALRCALFAQRYPDRVARLALDAMVWTGAGSPTLEARKKRVDEWRGSNRRPIDHAMIQSVFTRDNPNTSDPAVVKAFADQVLALDTSVPTGTYLDMTTNLPVCDPEKITVPTIVMRGQFDGIASLEDVLAFYAKLPNADKQFAMMPGIAHSSLHEINKDIPFAIIDSFFGQPAPIYKG
jgi:pimeloyl-ACP methyl ester carboxylesterase